MTAAIPLRPVSAPPPDPLALARTEMESLHGELRRLDIFQDRRAAAETRLGEIADALKALDRADAEAVKAWTESGDPNSPPPESSIGERKAILSRKLEIEAERDAAEAGVLAVQPKRDQLLAKISAVQLQMLQARLDLAVAVALENQANAETIAARLREPLHSILGLRAALLSLSSAAAARRDQAAELAIAGAIARIDSMPPLQLDRDPQVIASEAADWLGRFR